MKTRLRKSIDRLAKRTGQLVSKYDVCTLGWLKWLEKSEKDYRKKQAYIRKYAYVSTKVRRRYYSDYEWRWIKYELY